MARKPKTKRPKLTVKYLNEMNTQLCTELYRAERKLLDQADTIKILQDALKRPAVALFSDNQLNILLEFIAQQTNKDELSNLVN